MAGILACPWGKGKSGSFPWPTVSWERILLPGALTWCNEGMGSHGGHHPAEPSPALHAPWRATAAISFLEGLHHTVSEARLGTCRGTLSSASALRWGRQRLATAWRGFQGQAGQDRLSGGRARSCCSWCLLCSEGQVLYLEKRGLQESRERGWEQCQHTTKTGKELGMDLGIVEWDHV